jgi:YHS domain-containing protein
MKIVTLFKSLTIAATLVLSSLSYAADIDVNANENDLAIHGYDTVSYFTEGKATKGSKKYTASYKNAIYQFSSMKNRALFKADPEQFAPKFGGYCAMGVALNKKLDIDPTAWKIVEGKLYLNLNKAVQKKWLSDVPGHLTTANRTWSGIQAVSIAQLDSE